MYVLRSLNDLLRKHLHAGIGRRNLSGHVFQQGYSGEYICFCNSLLVAIGYHCQRMFFLFQLER